jgi:diguanylate cyclase (GGDEF)-like protein
MIASACSTEKEGKGMDKERHVSNIETAIDLLNRGCFRQAEAVLAEMTSCEAVDGLRLLATNLRELSQYAEELAEGNLSALCPARNNYVAMSVKNLHSKLNHLVWQIGRVAQGDYGQRVDCMGDLSDGFNLMISQLLMRKKRAEYELEHDAQTGLLNREIFTRRVYDAIRQDPEKHGAMICAGLDNIRYINETYGHKAGDAYISAAAAFVRSFAGDGPAARIAGDEFAFFLCGYEETADALAYALPEAISKAPVNLDGNVKIRASFGMALYPQDAVTADLLLKYSGHAMFEAKRGNRGTCMRFSAEVYQRKANLFDRQEKLNSLLEEKLIRFAFQPIVRLKDGSVFGYEALMRSASDVFSGPLDILAVAEAQSKLLQLERLTFEKLFEWVDENLARLKNVRIFFNTISTQFMSAAALKKIHPDYADICDRVVFEMLETTAESESFIRNVETFRRQIGAQIAIDDYGSGYSNDFRLIRMAPDIVKIDRFLIKGIDKDPDRQQLLSKTVSYCRAKKIDTLAEGIETQGELETVIRMGFVYAQGYYFGKPDFELREPAFPRSIQ